MAGYEYELNPIGSYELEYTRPTDVVAPEYTPQALDQQTALYAQGLEPYRQQSLSNMYTGLAGTTVGRGSAAQYGAGDINRQLQQDISSYRAGLGQAGLAAQQQERQFVAQQEFQKAQANLLSSQWTEQFNEQQRQFKAQLDAQYGMGDEDKELAWAKFLNEQQQWAATFGLQREQMMADMTGSFNKYEGGGYTPGYMGEDGKYVSGAYSPGTLVGQERTLQGQAQDWTKFSQLAQLISSGAMEKDAAQMHLGATNPYYDLIGGVSRENQDQIDFANKFGMTPYQLALYQSMFPEEFKKNYQYKSVEGKPYGGSVIERVGERYIHDTLFDRVAYTPVYTADGKRHNLTDVQMKSLYGHAM